MHLQEIIFCATAPASASAGSGAISLHDIQSGSSLASFKHSSAGRHSTSFIASQNGQGGFILASQADKSILNVYNFQKDQLALKIVLPEKLTCLAVDSRGDYCAGGTAQGRIYLWEIASGILFNAWDAHYRRISVLKFTYDGVALLSGSEDSGVSVWSVSRLLDIDLQNELPIPYCSLSDHTLPVTDIVCGAGPFPTCRALTSSVDHSVKLWDLSTRSLLTTFQLPQPIACLAWDLTERMFFAGSNDGSILQVNLFRQRDDKVGAQSMEAIGGAGVHDIIRIENELPVEHKKRLISVNQPITCLTISLTSSLLLAGTSTGFIHIYDIPSHQLLRTISAHSNGFSITHLAPMLKPPDLIGHVPLRMGVSSATETSDVIPVKPVAAFHRIRDAKAREAHEVAMLLPAQDRDDHDPIKYTTEELLRDHAYFVSSSPATETAPNFASLQSKVVNLETEVQHLREQLRKAKSINDTMWETVVQRVIGQSKKPNGDIMEVDEGEKGYERESS